jgi:hypothetical protein
MNEREIEQREEALMRSSGICPVCNKPIVLGQYAHKIGNREMEVYTSTVIGHALVDGSKKHIITLIEI